MYTVRLAYCIILLLPIQPAGAFHDRKYIISGCISGREGILPEASVYVPGDAGTYTGNDGSYHLRVSGGNIRLIVSYVGYEACTLAFKIHADTMINITLSGRLNLDEVQICARRCLYTRTNVMTLSGQDVKALPGFMGGADPLQALRLLPGVQSAGDMGAGLYVRGGGPDQNLVLLDKAPLYNASHLLGMFSMINADAVDKVEIIKGGFPARYGGRVSSIINISMKDGDMQRFRCDADIGLVAAKVTAGGPLWRGRTSVIVSARRTYIEPLLGLFSGRMSDGRTVTMGYYFYDASARLTHRFGDKDHVSFGYYTGSDRISISDRDEAGVNGYQGGMKWGNTAVTANWKHIFTNRLSVNTSASLTRYRSFTETLTMETRQPDDNLLAPQTLRFGGAYHSGATDLNVSTDFGYIPSERQHIRSGLSVIRHVFHPGDVTYIQQDLQFDLGNGAVHAWEYSAYAENDMHLWPGFKANVGLHWSGFAVEKTFYNEWQPRVAICWLLTDKLSLEASYSRMAQYAHLLANSNAGLPTDLWVPSTSTLKPQAAWQTTAGMVWNGDNGCEAGIEAYYKAVQGVLEYREGASFIDPWNYWDNKVLQGDGQSYGLELFLCKRTGSWTGRAGYTLSWSNRRFDEINNGQRFDYKYDRRHDVSLALMKRFGKRLEVSAAWVYGTGNCVTLPETSYRLISPVTYHNGGQHGEYYDYPERNSYRMPPYHRLDLSIGLTGGGQRFEWRCVAGAYNVYCRKNPFYIDIDKKIPYLESAPWDKSPTVSGYVQYSLFPAIPYISFRVSFK